MKLEIGMRLFHKSKNGGIVRECKLHKVYTDEHGTDLVHVKLLESAEIGGIVYDEFCRIPLTQFGKMLFFDNAHTYLSVDELAKITDYVECGNEDIIKSRKAQTLILQSLEARNINYLMYFTRIENLNSILKHGIVPINSHKEKGICAVTNEWEKKKDKQKNGNGYSIEFPNYKILSRLRHYSNASGKYVIICLDAKSVLIDTASRQTYCEDNASSKRATHDFTAGIECLFLDYYNKASSDYNSALHIKRSALGIPDCFTTNPQAEIIIERIVGPKYIKGVVFENDYDMQMWLDESGVDLQNSDIEFCVGPVLFAPRVDHIHWPSCISGNAWNPERFYPFTDCNLK